MRIECSVIIPTLDRIPLLSATLSRLARLPDRGVEIIVVNNGAPEPTHPLRREHPDVRWIDLGENLGAAARNIGAVAARGGVLFMLDDDSWPDAGCINHVVRRFLAQPRLGAIACRVRLADSPNRHDAGGAPGVFFNCGAGVRRSAFLDAGGYPIDYDYYVEEYALSCELWRRGWIVESCGAALVYHQRTSVHRDANRMLRNLIRNNLRLWDTYAPPSRRAVARESDIDRYRRVAERECAMAGYEHGLDEAAARRAASADRSRPLTEAQFDALLGLERLRQNLRDRADKGKLRRIAIWTRGKGCEFVIDAAKNSGLRVEAVYDARLADRGSAATWRDLPLRDITDLRHFDADGIVLGTLSPGVAEDLEQHLRHRLPRATIINPAPWGDALDERHDVPASASRSRVA